MAAGELALPWPPAGCAVEKLGGLKSLLISEVPRRGWGRERNRGRSTAYPACPSPEPASGKGDGGQEGWEKERKEGDTQRALLGAKGTQVGLPC